MSSFEKYLFMDSNLVKRFTFEASRYWSGTAQDLGDTAVLSIGYLLFLYTWENTQVLSPTV